MYTDLLPITALIRRELLTSLRQQRFFWLIALCVFVSSAMALLIWPGENAFPGEMTRASRAIFFAIASTLGVGVILVIPALAGSSIVVERDEETFEMLAMTTARPWHVLLAKLINSAGHFLLMIIAFMPVAASAYLLVGLDTDVLKASLIAIAASALVCAAGGVVCSALHDRPMAAIGTSFLAAMIVLGFPYVLLCVLLDLFELDDYQDAFAAGAYFAPICAFFDADSFTRGSRPYALASCVGICLVVTIALILVAHHALRRKWGTSTGPHRETRWRSFSKDESKRATRTFYMYGNPVYMREKWFEYGNLHMRLLMYALPFFFSVSAYGLIVALTYLRAGDYPSSQAMSGWNILQAQLLSILLAALTSNLFTKERERGNMDALRMSLISSSTILAGKFRSALHVALALAASAMLGAVPLLFARGAIAHLTHLLFSLVMLIECLVMVASIVCFASLLARKTATASVLTFVLGFFAFFGNTYLLLIVFAIFRFPARNEEILLGVSPLMSYAWYINGNAFDSRYSSTLVMSIIISASLVLLYMRLQRCAYELRFRRDY